MSTANLIFAAQRTAGILTRHPEGKGLTFRAADDMFKTLDGSSFANRHAAQRAADRIASLSQVAPRQGAPVRAYPLASQGALQDHH